MPHPSCRIPDAGGLYATAHIGHTGRTWWPKTILRDFTLVFPFFCPLPVHTKQAKKWLHQGSKKRARQKDRLWKKMEGRGFQKRSGENI